MTATAEVAIEVEGLTCGYGAFAVVRDLSLTVNQGEIVVLLGPNGAGKTTTLLAISGLIKEMAGEVRVLGTPIAKVAPHRIAKLGLGHVAEGRALFFNLTVLENLKMGVRSARDLNAIIDAFPILKPLVKRKAGLLSGGEQQVLAIARALAAKPKALLVDEMSLGLSPIMVEQLIPVIRYAANEQRCGVLLVEQHLYVARELANRAYIVSHGSLQKSGDATELLSDEARIEQYYLGNTEALLEE
jgi:branched-chain amino acid transport system ATP-binding protein